MTDLNKITNTVICVEYLCWLKIINSESVMVLVYGIRYLSATTGGVTMIIIEMFRRILQRLRELQQRQRSRRELATLDRYALKDIGVSRTDALLEANKPFWRS
jgi:uncharacterized protein YjiS (DUF1127 family)